MINNENELMAHVQKAEQVIIYGAGLWGTVLARALCSNGEMPKLFCFAVTSVEGNRSDVMGIPVCELAELAEYRDSALLIIAAQQHEEMLESAAAQGFMNVEPLSRLCYAQIRQKYLDYSPEILADIQFLNRRVAGIAAQIYELDRSIHERISTFAFKDEIEKVNTAAFAEFKGCYRDRDIVVMGTGPSLNDYSPIEGAIHIGVNKACFYEKVQLDYYFAHDFNRNGLRGESRERYLKAIAALDCKRFIGKYLPHFLHTHYEIPHDERSIVGGSPYYPDNFPSRLIFSDICKHPLMDFCSVVFPALHFALYTNPKRIYVVGCDGAAASQNGSQEYRHFNGSASDVQSIPYLDYALNEMIKGHAKVSEYVRRFQPETEMISLSYGKLNEIYKNGWTK